MAITYIGEIEVTARTRVEGWDYEDFGGRTPATSGTRLNQGAMPLVLSFTKRLALSAGWSGLLSVDTGSPVTLDLVGGTTDLNGTAISGTTLGLVAVAVATVTASNEVVIGAGSNPVTTLWGATGDAMVVGPDSVGIISSLLDGFGMVAGTGDDFTLTADANPDAYVMVWWL